MKSLPLGYQDFKKIREEDKLYVDKTELIWKLVNSGEVYFLSRPRRFGKSLLLSTLEYFFKGQKSLFEGLEIAEKPHDWRESPVIVLRMNSISSSTLEEMGASLKNRLFSIADYYSVEVDRNLPVFELFFKLIETLFIAFGPVVVLIDEYDKPLLDYLGKGNDEKEKRHYLQYAYLVRGFLKEFYGKLKPADSMLKFLFITGVSKFTRTSIFSELNHLTDLSMRKDYAALLGYTETELTHYFSDYFNELCKELSVTQDKLRDLVRTFYNGFRFTHSDIRVYNPYSILVLCDSKQFGNYWYETGTPTFLINLIRANQYPVDFDQESWLSESAFATWDLDNLSLIPLMFQTGYLTIREVMTDLMGDGVDYLYQLDYPNKEVKQSLLHGILVNMTDRKTGETERFIMAMRLAFRDQDLTKFFETTQSLLSSISSLLHIPLEKYYHSLIHVIFALIGLQPRSEEHTRDGRIDTVVDTVERIYIFEFKLDKPAKEAMKQIHDKKYYEKFLYLKKPIRLVGVAIDSKKREISNWIVEDC